MEQSDQPVDSEVASDLTAQLGPESSVLSPTESTLPFSNSSLSDPPPASFSSPIWGLGLWFFAFICVGSLKDVNLQLHEGDRSGAATSIVITFVMFCLAATYDVWKAKRLGKIQFWHWLGYIPAAFVLLFGIYTMFYASNLQVQPVEPGGMG